MSHSSLIRTAAGIAMAGVLGIAATMPGPAPAMAGGGAPLAACGDLALYFKIDDIPDAGIQAGVLTAVSAGVDTNWDGQEITIANVSDDGQAFDWTSTEPVAMVAWKEADSSFWSDDGLPGTTGSVVDSIEQGISHVVFCGRVAEATATPTATPYATVEAETGTPRTTPPPTDLMPAGTSSPGWPLLLVVLAVAMCALLAAAPRSYRR
jgi:hypothetical protein